MRIDSTELKKSIGKQLSRLYIIHGIEPLIAQETLDQIIETGKKNHFLVRETYVVDKGFDWPTLIGNCKTQSLFSTQKIIDLRIPNGKPGVEGAQALIELSTLVNQDTMIVISFPKLDYKTQQTNWFVQLEKNGMVVQCNLIERHHLPNWISKRFAAQEQMINDESAEFIAQRVEGNLLAAHQEIQKIRLIFPEGTITQEQIEHSIIDVSRFQVFDLMPCLYRRDLIQYERILNGLKAEAEGLPLIVWAIGEEIHLIYKTTYLRDSGVPFADIARQLRLKPTQNKMISVIAPRFNQELALQLIQELHSIDKIVKGLNSGDPWQYLAHWGLLFIRGTKATSIKTVN